MINTNFGFVLRGDEEDNFPRTHIDSTRVQVEFSAGEHGIGLLNSETDSWCFYVRVTEAEALKLEKLRMRLNLSYIAPAGRPVAWKLRTAKNTLYHATSITPESEGGDYWAGTLAGKCISVQHAIYLMTAFHARVKQELTNDSHVRGQARNHARVRADLERDGVRGGIPQPADHSSVGVEDAGAQAPVGDS